MRASTRSARRCASGCRRRPARTTRCSRRRELATDLGTIRGDYLEELRRGLRDSALDLVIAPVERREIDLPTFYDEVLGPVAARVGDLWHTGAMSVAEEHFATSVNREARQRARALFHAALPNETRLVLACAPEEHHELGLQMAGDVLELAGYETYVLGALTPAHDLADFAERIAASAALIACSSPITIPGLLHATQVLHARGVPVLVGGRVVRDYPAVALAAEADGSCATTVDVVEAVETVLRRQLAGRGDARRE